MLRPHGEKRGDAGHRFSVIVMSSALSRTPFIAAVQPADLRDGNSSRGKSSQVQDCA
jgi:hypothetical protein